jgi:Ca-activated chloride channel family protein
LLLALYLWQLRRRRRYAVRYSSLTLLREAIIPESRWLRHLPFALFLAALAALVVAMARPVAVVQVPTNQTAIILAIDISRSMCATDIPPNRLAAAEAAALQFIQRQPAGTRIGVVAFAGFAQLVQAPTTDLAALEAAIDGLTTGRGTAIGTGILESLDAIAALNTGVAPSVRDPDAAPPAEPRPPGAYAPEVIVLLTDGVTTTGTPPLEAARQASERGVRVYTIGFGTAGGGPFDCGGQFGGGQFGGGQFGGGQFGGFRRGIDEETLVQVAQLTDGEYFAASSAGELQEVFANLPITYTTVRETTEVSAGFAAAGAILALCAVGLALLRSPLP